MVTGARSGRGAGEQRGARLPLSWWLGDSEIGLQQLRSLEVHRKSSKFHDVFTFFFFFFFKLFLTIYPFKKYVCLFLFCFVYWVWHRLVMFSWPRGCNATIFQSSDILSSNYQAMTGPGYLIAETQNTVAATAACSE